MSIAKKSIIFILSILILDQIIKILVKCNMSLEQEYNMIGSFARLRFVENPGMAFGMEFGQMIANVFGLSVDTGKTIGKLFLSLFRIFAVSAIGWYISKLIKREAPQGVIFGMSAVFAGAVGNILDSMFYGLLFGPSGWQSVAEFMPAEGGYAPFLFGNVVDMFYFPIIDCNMPDWSPIWANEHIVFFRPVFNLADAAITCSVIYLIIFQRKYFKQLQ